MLWTGHPFDLPSRGDEGEAPLLDTQTPEDIDFIRVEQVPDHSLPEAAKTSMNSSWLWSPPEPP